MILPPALRTRLARLRRRACELAGVTCYSRPALNDLDRKLGRWLDFDGGFFIEAGANDGVRQSNTYHLEKIRGWTGLLVEPVPALAAECRRNRTQPVVEAALVSRGQDGVSVELHSAGLMSTVAGVLGGPEATAEHVRLGVAVQELPGHSILSVRGRALSALLDEFGPRNGRGIDFLSLDVEGSESAALAGLDFTRHRPRLICVEARDETSLSRLLDPCYELVEVLVDSGTHRDLLYRARGSP